MISFSGFFSASASVRSKCCTLWNIFMTSSLARLKNVLSCRGLSMAFLICSEFSLLNNFFSIPFYRELSCWYHLFQDIVKHKFYSLIKFDKSFMVRWEFLCLSFSSSSLDYQRRIIRAHRLDWIPRNVFLVDFIIFEMFLHEIP